MSAAKISGLLYGALALLFVPILIVMAVVMIVIPKTTPDQPPAVLFLVFAIGAPFVYAAMGFITGAAAAFFYNLVASWIGGLEMHFEGALSPTTQVPLQS